MEKLWSVSLMLTQVRTSGADDVARKGFTDNPGIVQCEFFAPGIGRFSMGLVVHGESMHHLFILPHPVDTYSRDDSLTGLVFPSTIRPSHPVYMRKFHRPIVPVRLPKTDLSSIINNASSCLTHYLHCATRILTQDHVSTLPSPDTNLLIPFHNPRPPLFL